MNKYSIILRAYNAAEHISTSIESVMKQTYTNWELLIVNDGSTDNTGELCEEFAVKDNRIKVIHQENKGCLLATQTGVANSTGKYVCLLDADDWYEKNYLEQVNQVFLSENVDMVVVNYKIVASELKAEGFYTNAENYISDSKGAIKTFLTTTNYALWNKVVAKDKIKYSVEEQSFYESAEKTTNFGDDLYLLMPVLCGCEKIYFLKYCLYIYVIDQTSISHEATRDNWKELIIRNRLMEFTYLVLAKNQYIDAEIEKLIRMNTVRVLMPNISEIVKSKKVNTTVLKELKSNAFYKNVVLKTKIGEIYIKFGKKRAILFGCFKLVNIFN